MGGAGGQAEESRCKFEMHTIQAVPGLHNDARLGQVGGKMQPHSTPSCQSRAHHQLSIRQGHRSKVVRAARRDRRALQPVGPQRGSALQALHIGLDPAARTAGSGGASALAVGDTQRAAPRVCRCCCRCRRVLKQQQGGAKVCHNLSGHLGAAQHDVWPGRERQAASPRARPARGLPRSACGTAAGSSRKPPRLHRARLQPLPLAILLAARGPRCRWRHELCGRWPGRELADRLWSHPLPACGCWMRILPSHGGVKAKLHLARTAAQAAAEPRIEGIEVLLCRGLQRSLRRCLLLLLLHRLLHSSPSQRPPRRRASWQKREAAVQATSARSWRGGCRRRLQRQLVCAFCKQPPAARPPRLPRAVQLLKQALQLLLGVRLAQLGGRVLEGGHGACRVALIVCVYMGG